MRNFLAKKWPLTWYYARRDVRGLVTVAVSSFIPASLLIWVISTWSEFMNSGPGSTVAVLLMGMFTLSLPLALLRVFVSMAKEKAREYFKIEEMSTRDTNTVAKWHDALLAQHHAIAPELFWRSAGCNGLFHQDMSSYYERDGIVLLAWYKEQPVGYIAGRVVHETGDVRKKPLNYLHIDALYVEPPARLARYPGGKRPLHISQKLYDQLVKVARERSTKYLLHIVFDTWDDNAVIKKFVARLASDGSSKSHRTQTTHYIER